MDQHNFNQADVDADNLNLREALIFENEFLPKQKSVSIQQQQYALPVQSDILIQTMYQQNAQVVQEILAANHLLGRDVAKVTGEMLKNMRSLQRENAARKKEKVFRIDEDGFIMICQCYEDGSEKIIGGLSKELYFPIEMNCLIIPEEVPCSMKILEIVPGDEDYTCFVPLDKVSGKTIYNAMIRAGIVFNPQFKSAEVCSFLERMLLPKINDAVRIIIHHLSGWDLEKGRFVQGSFWSDWAIDCQLPRDSKIIEGGALTLSALEQYAGYFRGITDEKLRIILWLYPFIGIANSVLEKNGLYFKSVLNLVLMNSVELMNSVAFLLKTYQRNKSGNLSILDKSVSRYLGEAKDEILILKSEEVETAYAKRKQKEQMKRIVQYACKEQQLPDPFNRELLGVLCLLTKIPLDDAKVIHLYVEKEDFASKIPKMGTNDQDVMQKVWSGYVEWIQLNWENVQRMIQSFAGKCNNRGDAAVFEAVFYLAERYFESLGFECFYKTIGLLSNPDFEGFFTEESDGELIRNFVTEMRVAIQEYYVQDIRRDRSFPENEKILFIDSEFLSIGIADFDALLSRMRIEKKQGLLSKLANMGMLVANTDQYYCYLQLSLKRFRIVKIRLELFERIGEISIADLGKEKKANVNR